MTIIVKNGVLYKSKVDRSTHGLDRVASIEEIEDTLNEYKLKDKAMFYFSCSSNYWGISDFEFYVIADVHEIDTIYKCFLYEMLDGGIRVDVSGQLPSLITMRDNYTNYITSNPKEIMNVVNENEGAMRLDCPYFDIDSGITRSMVQSISLEDLLTKFKQDNEQ